MKRDLGVIDSKFTLASRKVLQNRILDVGHSRRGAKPSIEPNPARRSRQTPGGASRAGQLPPDASSTLGQGIYEDVC